MYPTDTPVLAEEKNKPNLKIAKYHSRLISANEKNEAGFGHSDRKWRMCVHVSTG